MLQRYGSLSGKLHMIELEKDPAAHGLGISLSGDKDGSRARMSVYVADIDPEGPAGLDGRIQVGDELLEINGQILYGRSHQNASTIINNAPSKVKIILIRNKAALSQKAQGSRTEREDTVDSRRDSAEHGGLSTDIHQIILPQVQYLQHILALTSSRSDWLGSAPTTSDPLSCPVVAGRETMMEICKGNVGLGLSIVGGCDTLLGAVVIHEVNDGGAAQRDGRLQAGDQILEVNGIDLRQATHDEAIGVLRLTTRRVRLCVFRHQETYREEDLWDVFTVELRPRPGEGLGLTTVGKSNDTGIFVSDIIRGGVADSDGRLLLGDQILSINGEDVRAASQEHAQKLLQVSHILTYTYKKGYKRIRSGCSGVVHLEVARFKAGVQYSHGKNKKKSDGPCDSLGICVAGGVGSPHGNVPLFIATMDTNGLAAKTQLKRGDQIIAVNGHCLEGVTHAEAVDILKKTKGSVVLTVLS
uniref:PDZ domain-containing protein n=1 Tax=Seriola dumerili TaxID=41447 RepID=A0A3B4TFP0_SERDU